MKKSLPKIPKCGNIYSYEKGATTHHPGDDIHPRNTSRPSHCLILNSGIPMKTINIKGKEYVTVNERLIFFNENYPQGYIETSIQFDGEFVRCRAKVTPDIEKPGRFFVGHAEEDRTQGMINKTSAVENCETSAVGRALAMMGIGIIESVASADEVTLAVQKQDAKEYTDCEKCGAKKKNRYKLCYPCKMNEGAR